MAKDIDTGYRLAAQKTPGIAGLVPVGLGWNRTMDSGLADTNPYDGISAGKIDLWATDNYHASTYGYYLEALLVFGRVTGRDPLSVGIREASIGELSLDPAVIRKLEQIAHDELAEHCQCQSQSGPSQYHRVEGADDSLATGGGDAERVPRRLTLAQAFNSLATTVGPIFGASFILANGLAVPDASKLSAQALAIARREQAHVFQMPFLIIAALLIVMAIVCWSVRHWGKYAAPSLAHKGHAALLSNRRLMFGVVSIFLYVGAEVSIGSSMTNYLMLGSTLSAAAQTAGTLVSVYWGLAMVGRFMGAAIMRKANPALVLILCACGAFVMTTTSSLSMGTLAAVTILAVGLFNSIMFPTIFALAVEGMGERTPQASGIICLAIVGGAIVPLVTGVVADHVGLSLALLVPAGWYISISFFGIFTPRNKISHRSQLTVQLPSLF